jgi:hypothetical protein
MMVLLSNWTHNTQQVLVMEVMTYVEYVVTN